MRPKRISRGLWTAAVFLALTLVLTMASACRPSGAGWDFGSLIEAEPSIVALEGQRLVDMLPFPALDGDRIALVACRFAREESVRIRGGGSQWPDAWGRAAVRALARSAIQVELVLEAGDGSAAGGEPNIEIIMIEAVGGAGPRGLGDTFSECDVSPSRSAANAGRQAFRGRLTGAVVRMRRAQLDNKGLIREASAEEWVGALMHELAHALGFVGHVAVGHSILVRDESRIRAAGRRALNDEGRPDATLEALYRLRPGQRLGTRKVRQKDALWLRAMRKLDLERSAEDRASRATFSSVGDHEARIVWRYADGSHLGVRLPHWRSEIRRGSAITVRPDRATRLLLGAAPD